MNQDGIYGDTCESESNEWVSFRKKHLLSFASNNARYTLILGEITSFGMKNSLRLPSSKKN